MQTYNKYHNALASLQTGVGLVLIFAYHAKAHFVINLEYFLILFNSFNM